MAIKRIVYICFACVLFNIPSYCQTDTKYVQRYDTLIMMRLFTSQKYASVVFRYLSQQSTLRYRPNSKLLLGVGGTYGPFTLNLGYGFDFLNPDNSDTKGTTKGIDLQLHLYSKKFSIDLVGQFNNGFYLNDKQFQDSNGKYYTRPDIKVRELGVSGQYIVNHKRFSYRAALSNSDWQKKSAGSLLAGAEILGGEGIADSTMLPGGSSQDQLDQSQRLGFFQIGPNLGYAYTLVIHKRFYVTGSLTASLVYEFYNLKDEQRKERVSGVGSNNFFRAFAGYNGSRWAGGISWIHSNVSIASSSNHLRADVNVGKVTASVVYRLLIPTFKIKKKLPDQLQF
jgi:hypothetical protein